MSVKRLDRSVAIVVVAVALALGGSSAEAQLTGGRWRLPPQTSGGGNKAVEVKTEPTVVVTPSVPGQTVFAHHPVAFTFVPAILMSDGSVFANFGLGFEPVLRPCSAGIVVGQPSRVVGSNGVVLTNAPAPTYTQPVPAQMTPSQQTVRASQTRNGTVTVSQAAQLACFSRDASGRVFALRP